MGKCPNNRKVKKRRYSHKTARLTKFLRKGDDAVYDELQKRDSEKNPLPFDEDLPGMGQYYCFHCDRYFADLSTRDEHFKTKRHKKRLKEMMGTKPHTQLDADLAAGMGMPDNGPKLMSM
ncbi:zinc finger protein 593-like [Pistacia vera]|uniref:zinc finger protein 593-like n=1 Tax=Pistacia vera TaxID=55513 RepID=UPI001262AD7C|nr:zinc finger protein 593-like [Pistacia vera]XP_031256577.1 zinc finger protein 593-like [Pistacia vera]